MSKTGSAGSALHASDDGKCKKLRNVLQFVFERNGMTERNLNHINDDEFKVKDFLENPHFGKSGFEEEDFDKLLPKDKHDKRLKDEARFLLIDEYGEKTVKYFREGFPYEEALETKDTTNEEGSSELPTDVTSGETKATSGVTDDHVEANEDEDQNEDEDKADEKKDMKGSASKKAQKKKKKKQAKQASLTSDAITQQSHAEKEVGKNENDKAEEPHQKETVSAKEAKENKGQNKNKDKKKNDQNRPDASSKQQPEPKNGVETDAKVNDQPTNLGSQSVSAEEKDEAEDEAGFTTSSKKSKKKKVPTENLR